MRPFSPVPSIVPIKFRCSYCRQFLGISRAQAGGVVDCPTCGRSIRVPLLDGTVQPMADPELNMADAHLSRALDELARLADAPVQKMVPLKSTPGESEENEAENLIPQPLPEPIPIEVPLPPTPVIVQPPANATLTSNGGNGVLGEAGLLAELAALSAAMPMSEQPQPASTFEQPVIRSRQPETRSFKFSLMVLGIFLTGMLTERFIHLLENLGRPKPALTEHPQTETSEGQFTGRITYKTKEGESLPDQGARVLVFPQQRSGEVKLSIVGFRPADSSADQRVANAFLRALGGGAGTVDDQGRFQVPIEAGSYQLLLISHHQPNDNSAPNPALAKLLADYFDKPDDLLGRVQFQFSPLRIKGTGDIFDHSF